MEEDDLFQDSFQLGSQALVAMNRIEAKHDKEKQVETDEVGDKTMAALLDQEMTVNFDISREGTKKGRRSSLRLQQVEVKALDPIEIKNDNEITLEINKCVNIINHSDISDEVKSTKSNRKVLDTNSNPASSLPSPPPLHSSTPTCSNNTNTNNIVSAKSLLLDKTVNRSPTQIPARITSPIVSPHRAPEVSTSQLLISEWGLPTCVQESYMEKGIISMFPWQVECLTIKDGAVLAGGNLVYSAPTSAGKTLVAEILMMKRVFETGKKALLILPFVSLAREKMFHLQSLLREAGLRVEGFMGSQSPVGGLKSTDIGVATIEKANSLVNRLMEEGQLDTIGCVVVDELHMLGDQSRGYLLELLLTKILYVSGSSVQIIGMSATLPNLGDLAMWLKASLYTTTFRPVPLTELVKIDNTLLSVNLKPVGAVRPTITIPNDTDHITWLCLETILESHSVLLFCPIKSWVEKLAESLANDFFQIGRPDPQDMDTISINIRAKLQGELSGNKLGEVIEQLRRCPAGLDSTMAKVLRVGVAFHHAGLTTDERDIVEAGFKSGVVRVLVATSTLSSGVNLPARRVILRCPLTYNGQLMDRLQYKQMVGRAGRKGVDTQGESIIICKQSEREKVSVLVTGEAEPVVSCLASGGSKLAASMKRAILEVIVSGAASTRDEVERYASCTLLAAQMVTSGHQENIILECVEFLEINEFIRLQDVDGTVRYVATRLGLACLASSLAPDEGLTVFSELRKARRQFVLENELHIIYLIVPIYAAVSWPKLDWMGFLTMWGGLSEDMRRVGTIVGVEERWMVRAMRGTLRLTDQEQRRSLAIHQRFYTALALHDLVHEVSLANVAAKYGATKGMLQGLQQAASTFAGMVTVFSARLGWNNLELLVGQFQDRLEFGVQRELIELCRLTSIDGARARILFDAGLESVASLAATKVEDVENVLHASTAFSSRKSDGGEGRRKVKNIFISGLPSMTEEDCAKLMVMEARAVMKRDLGLTAGAWGEGETGQRVASGEGRRGKRMRSGRGGETPPSLGTSPHLSYQMENCQPSSLTAVVHRKLVSPPGGRLNTTGQEDRGSGLTEPVKDFNPHHKVSQTISNSKVSPQLLKFNKSEKLSSPVKSTTTQYISSPLRKTLEPQKNISPSENKAMEEVSPAVQNIDNSPLIKELKEKTITPTYKANEMKVTITLQKEDDQSPALRKRKHNRILDRDLDSPQEEMKGKGVKRGNSSRKKSVKIARIKESQTSPKCSDNSTLDLFDISGMLGDTFDMSSVMETIFLDEAEGGGAKKRRKKVSWGDEKEGVLAKAKEITQVEKENSNPEDQKERGMICDMFEGCETGRTTSGASEVFKDNMAYVGLENSFVPRTPKFQVCSEDLDLHWSDSSDSLVEDEDQDDYFQERLDLDENLGLDAFPLVNKTVQIQENEDIQDGEANNDSGDVFGDTISDSFLDRAMDQQQQPSLSKEESLSKRTDLSPGMMMAVGDLDSQVEFCSGEGFKVERWVGQEVSLAKRKKKRGRMKSVSPGLMILSDSEEEERGEEVDLCVVDVCSNRLLFTQFVSEWKSKCAYSLAVAVDRCKDKQGEDRLLGNTRAAFQTRQYTRLMVDTGVMVGLAVSWTGLEVYYLSLENSDEKLDDSLSPPNQDMSISIEERLCVLCEVMVRGASVSALGWRRQASLLYSVTGLVMAGTHSDPAIAAWLLDPSSPQSTISKLVLEHCPSLTPLLSTLGSGPGHGSVAANPAACQPPRYRALAEAVLVNKVTRQLEMIMEKDGLFDHYNDVEMRCDMVLLKMELTGMGLNEREYEDTRLLLEARLRIVEEGAYRLAGRHFSLSSPPDICKLLYHELRMPVNGDPKLGLRNVKPGRGGIKLSASKDILEKLIARDYQLPALILEHRRLSSAISKTVAPLLTMCQSHLTLVAPRVYSTTITHTSTGRVALHEPNLQNIPKNFEVELTEDLKKKALGRRASSRRKANSSSMALSPLARLLAPLDPTTTVSLRHAIVPMEGNLLLSADYSQLELRVLAHLSSDQVLLDTLRKGGDVFKSMAAQINRCNVEEVTDNLRQQAKQIVYGLVYGIGDKALADQLGVDQMEAVRFMEAFKSMYKGVRTFLMECVTLARKSGFVETMCGRKRRLEDINHSNLARRTAAERQAVNTRVQGSAADLVKTAMVKVEEQLMVTWPSCRPIKWSQARQGRWKEKELKGAWLTLQLHDELIYEVSGEDVVQVALIVRQGMEKAVKFSVPTPVRIKVGVTWGALQEFSL